MRVVLRVAGQQKMKVDVEEVASVLAVPVTVAGDDFFLAPTLFTPAFPAVFMVGWTNILVFRMRNLTIDQRSPTTLINDHPGSPRVSRQLDPLL